MVRVADGHCLMNIDNKVLNKVLMNVFSLEIAMKLVYLASYKFGYPVRPSICDFPEYFDGGWASKNRVIRGPEECCGYPAVKQTLLIRHSRASQSC